MKKHIPPKHIGTRIMLLCLLMLASTPFVVQSQGLGSLAIARNNSQATMDAHVMDRQVSLTLSQVGAKELFRSLEAKTGLKFVYDRGVLQSDAKISVDRRGISLYDLLHEVSLQSPFRFKLINQNIHVRLDSPAKDPKMEREDINVRGRVTDANGMAMPGVSVLVEGSTQGTVTDLDGNYAITVPEGGALVFSFIGFRNQRIAVGTQTVINITMQEDLTGLDEVVVTALGIKREAKSLGYSTSTVSQDEMTINRTPNFMNALQGKMAGVNITSLGTGPSGTSKIRIRGQSSFGGNNSPLIVVDGIPLDNTNFGARGDFSDRGSNRTSDGGDGLNSINPDNIESMTVLKGGAASALYGSRAKDGVIMITTKNRGTGKGVTVEFNSNFTHDTPMDFRDYQFEYGQGENGVRPTAPFPTSGVWSFGERFQPGMTHILFDNLEVPYEPQRNQFREFYRNGFTWTNSFTVASSTDNGGFNVMISNMDNQLIMPESDFNRKTINFGFTQTVAKKFTIWGNINYSKELRRNPPNIAEQDYSPVIIYTLANSMPMHILRDNAEDPNGNENIWSRFTNRTNPYFALKRFENIERDRVFGNITAKYDLADWIFVQGRVGQDFFAREQEYNLPHGTQRQVPAPAGFVNGQYVQDATNVREVNADFLISANKKFGDFGFLVNAGGNQMYRRFSRHNVYVQDFFSRDLYTIGNSRVRDPIYQFSERQVNSLYGSAEVSYKEFLYINGTLRNDWFSTLSPANRSILYPSITGSFIFSQAFGSTLPEWISFGKVRAAYSEVGSDTDVQPYSNNLFFNINAQQFPNSNGVPQPLGSIAGSVVPNANLRPMTVQEREFGLEMQLFDNRVGFEVTYYHKLSRDQILQAQLSDATGFLTQLINVGKSQNEGVEMLLNLNPIRTQNFRWDASFNAAYNITEVLDLGPDVSDNSITVGTADFHGELRHVVGRPMAQLYGFGLLRDAQGRVVHDPGNGRPLRNPEQMEFGSAIPTWVGGFTNGFDYKGINMSFLIDFKLGHKLNSGTHMNAYRHGLDKATLPGRDVGYVIGEGVNPNGEINTRQTPVQLYYESMRSLVLSELSIFNAGSWQLRQITLGYDFTRLLPSNFPVRGMRLNAVANNVAVIKKWVPHIHPDQFGFPSDNLMGLEATGLPVSRSIGFNLNLKF
nr:SusC/RagA family TonB-linked outer membrane protein [Lunatimonas lonarensis]